MHDGSIATLENVIEHYAGGGTTDHPNKSSILHPLDLTASEISDLVEFLKALTEKDFLHDHRWSAP